MNAPKKFSDQRIKRQLFPFSTFLICFFIFALLTTLQMIMIGQVIDYQSLPLGNVLSVIFFWVLAGGGLHPDHQPLHPTALSAAY